MIHRLSIDERWLNFLHEIVFLTPEFHIPTIPILPHPNPNYLPKAFFVAEDNIFFWKKGILHHTNYAIIPKLSRE